MSGEGRRDVPMALLDGCVRIFGSARPEWGRAMQAELESIEGQSARWAFALGCVRAITFRLPAATSQKLVAATGLAAAVVGAALVFIALVRYPSMVSGARTWVEVGLFTAVLLAYAGCLAHLLAGPGDRRATLPAVGAGATIAGTWLVVGADASLGGPRGLTMAALGLGLLVALASGWIGRRTATSSPAGPRSVGIVALIAALTLFVLWAGETVATAGRPYDAGLLRDFKASGSADLATYAVSDNLGTGMVLVVLVPLLTLVCGLAGAAAAGARRSA